MPTSTGSFLDAPLADKTLRHAFARMPPRHRFGRVLEAHTVIDSTSRIARALADAGAPEGTVVVADQQTAGRGRQGREWYSPPGRNLYLTVVLRPPLLPERVCVLTLATGVAVADAIEQATGLRSTLKWPNDVLIGGKKCGGILTEMATGERGVSWVTAGIGLNVNVARGELPEELRERATSLSHESGRPHDRAALCAWVLERLETTLATLYVEGAAPILKSWRERAAHLGKSIRYEREGKVALGKAIDVDDSGALIVEREDGERIALFAGEISFAEIARA